MSEENQVLEAPTSDAELNDALIPTEEANVEIEETAPEIITLTKDELEQQKNAVAKKERERAERKYRRETEALRAEFDTKFQSLNAPKPSEESKPLLDNFETYDLYVEALTDWKLDKARKDWDKKDSVTKENQRRDNMAAEHSKRADSFRKQQVDYDEAIESFADLDFKIADDVVETIGSSQLSAQIFYHLSKNLDELERINDLSPLAAAREIGKLELKLEQAKVNKTSSAPTPISPLGQGGNTATKDPSKMQDNEWYKWDKAQNMKRK